MSMVNGTWINIGATGLSRNDVRTNYDILLETPEIGHAIVLVANQETGDVQ